MKLCLYCEKDFEPKKPKAIYCSNKCRTYANRKNRKLVPKDINWIIDKNGVKRTLNKSTLLSLLGKIEGNVPETKVIAKKPQANDFIWKGNDFIKHDEVSTHHKIEIVDYQKLFNECEFPDEYKALWERINNDPNVSVKEKTIWKIRLNVK